MTGSNSTFAKKAVVPVKAVNKIINCTETVMHCYGTSGLLLELPPRVLDLSKVRLRNKGVLYVVNEDAENELLEIDEKFADIIVRPSYIGNGREGEDIYKFSLEKENVVPITDNCGATGDILYY